LNLNFLKEYKESTNYIVFLDYPRLSTFIDLKSWIVTFPVNWEDNINENHQSMLLLFVGNSVATFPVCVGYQLGVPMLPLFLCTA